MINLNQLRVFCQAAKCENFTLAAKKLFITQPAVTAQIKMFEDQCNLKLFKKKGRNIYLTDEGKTLYDYARKIFEWEKEIENLIDDMRDLKRGTLRLGVNKTYARYFMPFVITGFREAYPHIKINLDEGSSLDMIYSLVDLRNELAVIAKVGDHPNVCFIPFSQEEIVLILAPDHPLATKTTVSVKELEEEPIIMKEAGSGTRLLVNKLFEASGLTPNILMETSNTEFIKQLVQRGEGLSFLVREAVAIELHEKKLTTVPIGRERTFLDVSIAYLKNQTLSPAAQSFLDVLLRISSRERPDQGIRAIMGEMLARWRKEVSVP
jgi:DNA-binding transcriptional LysR family regulator